jgi:hypothetical protein
VGDDQLRRPLAGRVDLDVAGLDNGEADPELGEDGAALRRAGGKHQRL